MGNSKKTKKKKSAARRRAESQQQGSQSNLCLNIPEGLKFYSFPKEDTRVVLNVVPFVPLDSNPYGAGEDWYYERSFWMHKIPHPKHQYGLRFVCPLKEKDEECPVCAAVQKANQKPLKKSEKDYWNSVRCKERQLILINDPEESGKEAELVRIHECSLFNGIGSLINNKLRDVDEEDDDENWWEDFYLPNDGASLKVSVVKESFNSKAFGAPKSLDFKKRKKLSKDVLKLGQKYCLDNMINVLSTKEVKALWEGTSVEPDESDEGKKSKKDKKGKKKKDKKGKKKEYDDDIPF